MILYGLLTSPIVLGAKQDLCATCNVAGPHLIVRRVRWVEIFFIPVLPIWISHRLVCTNCSAETKLGFGARLRAGPPGHELGQAAVAAPGEVR